MDIAVTDISAASEEGRKMLLIHPVTAIAFLDENKNPVGITLRGRHSDVARELLRQINDERAAIVGTGREITAAENEEFNTRYLVGMTVSWDFNKLRGEEFPCTPANARRFYNDKGFKHWRERALYFVQQDGNFLAGSA
jgi:hypothetical protein